MKMYSMGLERRRCPGIERKTPGTEVVVSNHVWGEILSKSSDSSTQRVYWQGIKESFIERDESKFLDRFSLNFGIPEYNMLSM